MQTENGDDYIRKVGSFIRTNEQRLADIPITRGRQHKEASPSLLSWVGLEQTSSKPLLFTDDPHHLFYILMRFDALGINVGSLDVRVQNLSRPTNMSYLAMLALKDRSDVLSISSLRSTISSVSMFSLGGSWFGRSEPTSIDSELKYVYSAFTKLPALRVRASGPKIISELANDPPLDSAVPVDAFKNLMMLECQDVDPRILLGWDILSATLRSLTIKRSGMEDVSYILVDSVIDDKVRRDENGTRVGRPRLIHRPLSTRSQRSSRHSSIIPPPIQEESSEGSLSPPAEQPHRDLPPYAWSFLSYLCFADNNLTFMPSLPPLPNLVSLDLSSNLLISVPPSLSTLSKLKFLNLAHNMVDSVLGIYQQIPLIMSLNISANRLESLCGLERLEHLARIDLRENKVDDLDEIGRLAVLTSIKELWISNNPCTLRIQDWRVRCFDLFAKENREVVLDGSGPGMMERRSMLYQVNKNVDARTLNHRPASILRGSSSAPQIPSVKASSVVDPGSISKGPSPSGLANAQGVDISEQPGLQKPRRKKHKRVVDLNAQSNVGDSPMSSIGSRHIRHTSEVVTRNVGLSASTPVVPQPSKDDVQTTGMVPRPELHRSSTVDSTNSGRQRLQDTAAARTLSSAAKSAKRRARLSPSLFEPSFSSMALPAARDNSEGEEGNLSEAERFRKRIEALRNEVGDSWLKVLSQTHFTSPDDAVGHRA